MGSPYSSKAKSIITCEVSDQAAKIDSKIKISGSIWPVHMALVFIQVSKDEGETWDNLAMATTENGNYSYEWTPKVQGAYLLRSFWTGDMDHKKMTSPTVKVDITQEGMIPMLKTQLFEYHEKNAHMFEFANFQMPLWYEGIVSECLVVRNNLGMFDISHMGRVFVSGSDAEKFLNYLTTNNVAALKPNHAQYTLICNREGGIKDDLVIFKFEERPYLVVCNAGNRLKDVNWIKENAKNYDVKIHEASNEIAMVSVQGPKAAATIQKLFDGDLTTIGRFDCIFTKIGGQECILSRTGYTGEDGLEICILDSPLDNPNRALKLWNDILKTGEEFGIKPCGLGSRDVLRLEAGMSLYGHDITESTNPLEAKLDFVVKFDKGDFIGKDEILKKKDAGIKRKRVGLKVIGKGIPRSDCIIMKDGKNIGMVTSGTFSPILNAGIAMGYVSSEYSNVGERLSIEVHGKLLEVEVIGFPFYDLKLYGFKRSQ